MSVSIYDLIAFQARLRPEAPAVVCPQGTIRFRELIKHIHAMVAELQSLGVTGPRPVALIFPRAYLHLLLILALDRMNVTSVSLLAPGVKLPWKPSNVVTVIANRNPELDVPHKWIEISEKWKQREDDVADAVSNPADTLVRVILSSGSTGSPKPIAVRRCTLAARIAEHIRDLGLAHNSRVVSLHLFSGGPGYWTPLATLAAGGMLILFPRWEDCVHYAEILNVTHLSCSPYMLGLWLEKAKGLPPLQSLQMLETAGSHLPLTLGRQARNIISPNVYTLYGATEAGRIAFARLQSLENLEGAVGLVSPWCQVEIVDELDQRVEHGSEGVVRVKTAGIIESYFEFPEMTAKNLRNGWFYPGDVGSLSVDGFLRISSRVDDVVNLGGIKVSLIGAEEKLRGVSGVEDVAAFGVTGSKSPQLWAAVVRGDGLDEGSLKAAMQESKVLRVIYVRKLPRNENGKVVRQKLVEEASAVMANDAKTDTN